MIKNITKKQEKLILSYLEKWQKLVFITGKTDQFKAECAVKNACNLMGIEEPQIIFCQSPKEALNRLINQSHYRLENDPKYTLLKIDSTVDVEPVYLLKMICPSSGKIHILRVPPDTTSAKEAIIWVNLGINPFDFAEQT